MSDITYFRQNDQLGWVDIQRIVITVFGYGEGRLLTGPFSSTISRYDDGKIGHIPKTQNEWRSMQLVSAAEKWLLPSRETREISQGTLAECVDAISIGDRAQGIELDWSLPLYAEWGDEDKNGLDLVSRSILSLCAHGLLGEVSK